MPVQRVAQTKKKNEREKEKDNTVRINPPARSAFEAFVPTRVNKSR